MAAIEGLAQTNDGDFARYARESPYLVIGPLAGARSVLFSTKPSCVTRIAFDRATPRADFAIVARYGLPNDDDPAWICELAGDRAIRFLGDLDPPDLLAFAWLRWQIRPKPLIYAGIGDSMLAAIGRPPESYWIDLSAAERDAMPLVEQALPDFRELVGDECVQRLASRQKIEVEALMDRDEHSAEAMLAAMIG